MKNNDNNNGSSSNSSISCNSNRKIITLIITSTKALPTICIKIPAKKIATQTLLLITTTETIDSGGGKHK